MNSIYIEQTGNSEIRMHFTDVDPDAFRRAYAFLELAQSKSIEDRLTEHCFAWAETRDCELQLNQVPLTPRSRRELVLMLL